MAAPTTQVATFNLDGLEELARGSSPQLAAEIAAEAGTPAEPPAPPEEPPAAPEPAPASDPAAPAEPPEPPEEKTSNEDELAELHRQSAEAKAKPAAAPAAPAEPAPAAPATPPPRDDDLKLDEKATAHLNPKTRKVIEERNQKVITERNRADTLQKEKLELQGKLSAAEEAAKKIVVPKGVEEELTKLRERVRELDINHDPEIATKYDAPVKANQDRLVTLLSSFGLGKTVDGKDDPEALAALKKSGLDFRALAPYIKKLSDAGAEDAAEEVREILRENIRLGREREREVTAWRTSFDTKQAARQQEAQAGQVKLATEIRAHTENFLKADVAELTKDFPFMARPADPLPTDPPAVQKAKSDAIAAYEASGAAVAVAVSALDVSKAPPEKATEVHGRLAASAVAGVILRTHILPRLAKDLAALTARNKELEAQVGKIKSAGSLSRAHAAAASAPPGGKSPLPEDITDAAKMLAKEMGITIDS